jgi:hypothetical protein
LVHIVFNAIFSGFTDTEGIASVPVVETVLA